MMFQLTYEADGVVLEVHTDIISGRFEWVRLRKFWNEGDAKLFRMSRCPRMTENEIKMLARSYEGSKRYCFNGRWMVTSRQMINQW